ncbi:hypothetical protein FQZ97_794980 [compost metagenome]
MYIFAQHDHAAVRFHAAVQHVGHGVHELAFDGLARVVGGFLVAQAGQFRAVAAQAHVAESRAGPQLGAHAALAAVGGFRQAAGHVFHHVFAALAQRVDFSLRDQPAGDHFGGDTVQRVAAAPLRFLVLAAVAEGAAGEGAVLVEEAVDVHFDDGRAVARAHVRHGLGHGQVDRQRVHAVHLPGRNVEGLAARGQARLGGGFFHRGGHGVAVVFDEEAQRCLPGRGQVHGFQHGADVHRAVAEVSHRHPVRARVLVGPAGAGRQRHAAADDSVGAQRAGFQPAQVHAAAAAAAITLGQAHDLGQRLLQDLVDGGRERVARIQAQRRDVLQRLGEELMVAAVRAVDLVAGAQRQHRADRAAFLAHGRMRGAVHEAFGGQVQHGLFEGADPMQLGQHGAQQGGIRLLPVLGFDRQLPPGRLGTKRLVGGHE